MPFEQRGFTLIEALIALLIFAFVVAGAALTMKHLLRTQKDVHVSSIVLDLMQERLQGVVGNPSAASGDICDSINKNAFEVAGEDFYLGCHSQITTVTVDTGVTVDLKWPVLSASNTSQAEATGCADGSDIKDTCYMVGN